MCFRDGKSSQDGSLCMEREIQLFENHSYIWVSELTGIIDLLITMAKKGINRNYLWIKNSIFHAINPKNVKIYIL